MKLFLILYTIILTSSLDLNAQQHCDNKHDFVWIMGGVDIDTTHDIHGGSEINFSALPPSLELHPKIYRGPLQNTSMSSKSGELIYYSNGCIIINAKDELMANGDSINPGDIWGFFCPEFGYTGFQNMFSIPDSYNDSIYYLFYVDLIQDLQPDPPLSVIPKHLYYSIIDMRGDNGLGVVKSKNSIVLEDSTMIGSSLTAVKHANGKDWWIINPNRLSNTFNRIILDENGPLFLGKQTIGILPNPLSTAGQVKFSPDGSHYAWYHPLNGLFLYGFDRHTGYLNNFRHIEVPLYSNGLTGGLEFSPSSQFLYVNHDTSLFQVDVYANDIQESLTHIADFDKFGDPLPTSFFKMEQTPDNRIIMNVLNGSQWLHVIQEPDKKGKACRFEQHILKLPTVNNFTLPHFPNYRLGPIGEPLCDSIWVSTEYPKDGIEVKYKVGPNPTFGYLHIYPPEDIFESDFDVTIFDMSGSVLLRSSQRQIDLFDFSSGVYVCRISDNTGYTQISKVVTVR